MADSDKDVGGREAQRRPYEPPAIEETSEFETLALTCGHGPDGGPDCDIIPGS